MWLEGEKRRQLRAAAGGRLKNSHFMQSFYLWRHSNNRQTEWLSDLISWKVLHTVDKLSGERERESERGYERPEHLHNILPPTYFKILRIFFLTCRCLNQCGCVVLKTYSVLNRCVKFEKFCSSTDGMDHDIGVMQVSIPIVSTVSNFNCF